MLALALALVLFVVLGLPGFRRLVTGSRPADRAACALGLALLVPGALHFLRTDALAARVPSWLPEPRLLVLATGAADLVLALGLWLPATRRRAGQGAVLLFLLEWPAAVEAALAGGGSLRAWLRVPAQLLLVGWGLWCALGHLPGRELRRRLFARFYDPVQAGYEGWMAARKRPLLSTLRGRVLELGPGTGANFAYLDPSVSWTGVEPNPWMRDRLLAKAWSLGFRDAGFRDLLDGSIDVPDRSYDVVLSTLVLCSVPDPDAALREVRRVLVPGGRFVFVEHVAAPRGTALRRAQRLVRPLWSCMADGCEPDRDLAAAIRRAGFRKLELEEFRVPRGVGIPLVAPHVSGVAVA